jgi:hypothetical protein
VNWNEAKSYAEKQQFTDPQTGITYKGHLATITSPEENSWIAQNLVAELSGSNNVFWLGGYQDENAVLASEGCTG